MFTTAVHFENQIKLNLALLSFRWTAMQNNVEVAISLHFALASAWYKRRKNILYFFFFFNYI